MKIAVIGGGIAGHMAAAHVSRYIPQADLCHIYDPAVPAIGVGEGTLPLFPRWLHRITGLPFAQLQERCAVTWKKGIRFEGWGQINPQFNHFFGGENIAYHISAEKICPLLSEYIQAEQWNRYVAEVESDGRTVAIHFQEGNSADFDFVFDARGFPRILTDQHLPLRAIPTNAALLRRGPIAAFQGATRAVGQRFERLRQAAAAFPAEKLPLIPDPHTFAAQIASHKQIAQDFAGFDEFSFAQIGYGTGAFPVESDITN